MKSTGRTPYTDVFGEDYRREILPFAETVMAKLPMRAHRQLRKGQRAYKGQPAWIKCIWLGRSETTEEHLVGTPTGVVRCLRSADSRST